MSRMVGRSPSTNISGIDTPELTDFATGNYKNVIQKTLDNYAQAMSAATSMAKTDQQAAAELRTKAIQYEEERLAMQRAAQSKGGGGAGKILGAIAGLGKAVAQGLNAQEQVKQQQFENELALTREGRAQEAHDAQMEDRDIRNAQAIEQSNLKQLDAMLQSQTQEWELQLQDTIINGSREAGYTQASTYVDEFRNSEYFAGLPAHHQYYMNSNMNKWLVQQRGESLDEIEGERRAMQRSQRDVAVQQVQIRYAPVLHEINTGASVLSPDEVNERVGTINGIIIDNVSNDPALQGILKSDTAYMGYIAESYKPVAAAINNYYQISGQRASETHRYSSAIQRIAALEDLRSTPGVEMSDSEYVAHGTILLKELGLPGSIESFPTTQTNIARQRNEDYAQIERLEQTVQRSENLSRLEEDNPQTEQARNFLIGKKVYNALQDGSAEGDISDLEYAIKESPHEAQARGWHRILSYYKEFDSDRQTALDLQDELALREQKYAAMKARITPPNQVEVRVPGDSGLGVDPETGTPLGTTPGSRVDIVDVERRVPQATQEELNAIHAQMEVTRKRIGELGDKWERRGIDIYNPSNRQYLDALEERSAGILGVIEQEASVSQVNVSSEAAPPSAPPVEQQSGGVGDLAKALNSELERNEYYNVPGVKLPEGDNATQASIDGLNQAYLMGITTIKEAYAKGRTPNISELTKAFPGGKLGVDTKIYEKHYKHLVERLGAANELLRNKSNWYREKWGQPNDGVIPTPNFTDGGRRSRPQTVAVPRNRDISAPTMPLKGNLATMPSSPGYAPFKSGNVSVHSSYGMRTHPVTGKQKMHNGIDISSTDPRVATIQGGKVVYVSPKDGHGGGYGNYVVVKTPDGQYEMFAHLREVSVNKGQIIDPATQIGLMGGGSNDPGRGTSTGRHLHFGVATEFNGQYPTKWTNPVAYMERFTGNAVLPRGQGDLGHGTRESMTDPSPRGVPAGNYVGVRQISENVFYTNGYIFDRNTGRFRSATQNEIDRFPSYTPVSTSSHRTRNQTTSTEYREPDGTSTIENWRIPDEAQNEGTFLFVHPTGRISQHGQPILAIKGYKGNKELFAVEAVSGSTGLTGNRNTAGMNGMLPDGKWSVARNTIPGSGAGVGDKFLALTPTFGGHNRSAIGIHWDANKNGVTAGCLATFNTRDRDKIYQFVQNAGRSLNLYVNTTNVSRVLGRSTTNSSYTGNPQRASNQTSPNSVAFSGTNNPSANYGYSELARSETSMKALATAGDKIGIPAVWIADYLWHESGFNPNIVNRGVAATGESGAMGAFQVMPSTLEWLHPGMSAETYKRKGLVWQLTVSLPKYIAQIEKEAGKKVRSIHDFAAAIWGGSKWLRRSEAERTRRNINDGYITWNKYKKKWGSRVGRSYSNPQGGADTNIIHRNPRNDCPHCQHMLNTGDFSIHSIGVE